MFQWSSAVFCGCKGEGRSRSVGRLATFRSVLVLLTLLQVCGSAFAGNAPPKWTVPVQQTSDDGYALLGWESAVGDNSRLYRITESFNDRVSIHYTEATELRAWRVQPGEYEFVVQSCSKND